MRAELERLEDEARRAGERRSLTGQLGEVDAQLTQQRERLGGMSNVHQALEAARAALEASRALLKEAEEDEDATRTAWVRDRQDAETKRQSLRDQYVDRQKQRESSLCGDPIGREEHRPAIHETDRDQRCGEGRTRLNENAGYVTRSQDVRDRLEIDSFVRRRDRDNVDTQSGQRLAPGYIGRLGAEDPYRLVSRGPRQPRIVRRS